MPRPRRAGAGSGNPDPAAELKTVLSAYGAKRMVVGHTPSLAGILILQRRHAWPASIPAFRAIMAAS